MFVVATFEYVIYVFHSELCFAILFYIYDNPDMIHVVGPNIEIA